ncbi:Dipeptidyl aminopeptidase/acylaminoacyl peptidase [Nonlabens sp. Hel1_33_55]|uniref:S9 family peptidase n=1 Tax=Nonlabens sp. Hel1_33_55 TaxID=1336802 RepID=UPI000875E965|nr:prolyl oligopeptidase family serine peptidase [Nonlabens sp. Hel1_33_55]SCY00743.1 Dipeptidyl aminopeptidase/acylaminoacyl peptidase [Nonlabens sp. Hel1_33_55]
MRNLQLWVAVCVLFAFAKANSQEKLTYQQPSEEIMKLVDYDRPPWVLIDENAENMVLMYRDTYKSIADLSEEEMRLGGLRINPKTNIGSRTTFYDKVAIQKVGSKEMTAVKGLPAQPKLSNVNWSPDESMIAMTHTTTNGTEVWVLDVEKATARKLTDDTVNANMGNPIDWYEDGSALMVKMLATDRKPLIDTSIAVPEGPTISTSDGSKAQNRTYQDLLKNPADEHNFEQLALSRLVKVNLDGTATDFLSGAMYTSLSFSPDGSHVMVSKLQKPFSYIVTYGRFPEKSTVYDLDGNKVAVVNDVPLIEEMPQGFMAEREGKRNVSWRADKPHTLMYAEALDGGDPEKDVPYRDIVYSWEAPFNDNSATELLKTKDRFSGIQFGDDDTAIAYDYWWNTRNTRTYVFNPSDNSVEPKVISDRSYQDVYSDPGNFVTTKNEFGNSVLQLDGDMAYLMGDGYSDEGQFPFVDQMNLKTGSTKRIYKSQYTDKKESLVESLDMDKGLVLVRIEGPTEYPNYYIRDIKKKNKLNQISFFENPFSGLQNVHKELVTYKRDDGVDLSATLYLPPNYDMKKKEKLPMLVWAYPREYKDAASAGQNTQNPNEFIYPSYGSFVYWVMKGYAVLDDAAFPIIGEGDEEPNDTFIPQLVANGKAAIDAVDDMGYIDRNRVGVGGHSYGAFMTANLLAHSDLFAAGIARSGAYNRTLTPFGFQSEERNYWEAPDIYNTMSPFMNAEKVDEPILLVHGQADNNSGTYPLQSERYFNALKGLGATARLVMLPKESHGYAAKESILHVLWEQDQWLEKYVKNKPSTSSDMKADKKMKG